LFWPDLPATPPNWLENATYIGQKTYHHLPANAWMNNPYQETYLESVDKDRVPVALTGGDTDIQFNTVTLTMVPQSVYYLPTDGSCQKKCAFFTWL